MRRFFVVKVVCGSFGIACLTP
nr:DUF3265 domain-containing protein [Vibrio vulnificus]